MTTSLVDFCFPDLAIVLMNDEFTPVPACDFTRPRDGGCLSRQYNGVAAVALTEYRPPLFPFDDVLIDFHLCLDYTRWGGTPTGHAKK